jgi:predicted transcriptional regulator
MKRCRHDVKIGVLIESLEAKTKQDILKKTRLKPNKLNKMLDDFEEKGLIQQLKKSGTVVYHTTPKGQKLVKLFKNIMDFLDSENVVSRIFETYR